MTMSTSCAPRATTSRVSASFTSSDDWPEGNAVATDATFTPVPRVRSSAVATRFGYTQIAATDGMLASDGSGRMPFDASAATFPGVSAPSSVVRSITRIARSSANTFESRFIERVASDAARSSSATASTDPSRGRRGSSGSSNPPGRTGVVAISSSLEARAPGSMRLVDRAVQIQGVVRNVRIDLARLSLDGRADRARRGGGGGEPDRDSPTQVVSAHALGREHAREHRDLVDRTLEGIEALTEPTEERG